MAEEYPQIDVEDILSGASRSAPSRPGVELTVEDIMTPSSQVERPQRAPAKPEDIAKSVATQGVLGATADTMGIASLPGTVMKFAGEKLGLVPSEEERIKQQLELDRQLAERKAAHEGSWWQQTMPSFMQPKFNERGDEIERAYRQRLPTSERAEETITSLVPALKYEPQSEGARKAGEVARAAGSMAVGPMEGIAGRMTAGALGRAAGQQAGELQERTGFLTPEYGPYLEPLVSFVGTMGASKLGSGIKNLALPGKVADAGIAGAMAEDFNSGRVDPKAIQRMVDSETPGSLADIFGPGTAVHKFIEEQAGMAGGEGQKLVERYNAAIGKDLGVTQRLPESQGRTLNFLNRFSSLDAPTSKAVTERANDVTRNIIYSAVKADPAARAISLSSLGPDVANNDLIRQSVDAVTKAAPSTPKSWGVVAPKTTSGAPATPITGPNGAPLLDASGQPIMRPAVAAVQTPANLAFYDLVKRDLDRKIKIAESLAGGESYNPTTVESLKEARKNLVASLDNRVKSYAPTRAKAGELFEMDSAPEAGSDFYRKRMNIFDKADAGKAFSSMAPEAQDLFRTGWYHELANDLKTPGGMDKVTRNFLGDENFQQNAKMILGKEYDAVRGKVLSETIRNNAKGIKPVEASQGVGEIIKTGGKFAAVPAAIAAMSAEALTAAAIQAQLLSPQNLAYFVATGLGGAAAKGAEQFAATRVANRAIPLILSEKPEDLARLSKLAAADPNTAKMLANLNAAYQSIQQSTPEAGEQPESPRQGRATGGAVNLMALSKAAKKHVTQSTEGLLNESDDTVAHALEIANKHI
jgi:hypothetical protein